MTQQSKAIHKIYERRFDLRRLQQSANTTSSPHKTLASTNQMEPWARLTDPPTADALWILIKNRDLPSKFIDRIENAGESASDLTFVRFRYTSIRYRYIVRGNTCGICGLRSEETRCFDPKCIFTVRIPSWGKLRIGLLWSMDAKLFTVAQLDR